MAKIAGGENDYISLAPMRNPNDREYRGCSICVKREGKCYIEVAELESKEAIEDFIWQLQHAIKVVDEYWEKK